MSWHPLYHDRLGKPVPSRLEVVWRGRDSLRKMRTNLHNWRGALAGAVGGASLAQGRPSMTVFVAVPMAEISELVNRIDGLLAAAVPQVVCQCRDKYCPYCEGKQWLNASDARRISSQGQLPALSERLAPRPSSGSLASALNSQSETTRLLWLLAGPPDSSSPVAAPETALPSMDVSCCTPTS